ncbi:hypothetical protein N866_05045, partial [Actinotalea ferrariae CF5-4]
MTSRMPTDRPALHRSLAAGARPRLRPTADRRPAARVAAATALALFGGVVVAGPAAAHARWFADPAAGGDWGFFFSPVPLLLTAAVVAAAVAWRLVARRLPTPELPLLAPLGRLAPYVPRLLGIHMGVSLLAYSVTGAFLTPSLPLDEVPGGVFAGVVQAAVGIWLITGARLRVAALGVVLLGPPVLLAAGPVALLETADTLAVALFLAVLPPSDRTFGRVTPSDAHLRWAVLLVRVFVGVALITLAFSEKLTNPDLARNLLAEHPEMNLPEVLGLPVPLDVFIAFAGASEILFGLLILSGALPQVTVLVALVPFNLTLLVFGTTELIGHLPVYGVFLALLVYGSGRRTAAALPWFPGRADVRDARTGLRRAVADGVTAARGL